jgi:N-methylhydantoinase B
MTAEQTAQPLRAADLEIIRNRLDMITSEAGTAMVRASSSLVLAEAKDFGFTITDAAGRPMTVPPLWIGRIGLSVGSMIESLLDRGIEPREGDQFICNDPHLGALHLLDVGVFAPVFFEGECVAWVGSAAHHQDLGGLVSGWSVGATQSFHEGLIFPPTRLVSEDKVEEQIAALYLANVRYPDSQIFDLRAQVAANLVAKERLLGVIAAVGPADFVEATVQLRRSAEQASREAIAAIPDGVYGAVDYIDHDVQSDELYRVSCELTVAGDSLSFDFGGSDAEAPGFINCTSYCSVSTVQNVVLGLLVPGEIKNAGSFAPISVELPADSIVACSRTAPNSGATAEAGYRVQDVSIAVLSKALAASSDEAAARRPTAVWGGSFTAPQMAFLWPDGTKSGMLCMDATAMGGGARLGADGLDAACNALSIGLTMPNVESYEEEYPIVYLQRRLSADTGGAGLRRGGCGLRFSIALHPGEDCDVDMTLLSSRRSAPPPGLFGGYPGASSWFRLFEEASVERAIETGGISLTEESPRIMPQKVTHVGFGPGRILDVQCPGGGGLGDPLLRDPARVIADVRTGVVSAAAAAQLYGVVVDLAGEEPAVDEHGTAELRALARRQRAAGHIGTASGAG